MVWLIHGLNGQPCFTIWFCLFCMLWKNGSTEQIFLFITSVALFLASTDKLMSIFYCISALINARTAFKGKTTISRLTMKKKLILKEGNVKWKFPSDSGRKVEINNLRTGGWWNWKRNIQLRIFPLLTLFHFLEYNFVG